MKFIAPYSVAGVPNGSMLELLTWLDTVERVGFDIETIAAPNYTWYSQAGLDPHTSEIAMLQIGDKDSQFVIDTRYEDATSVIEKIKENNIRIIGTNLKFDYKHIVHKFGVRLDKLYDTMLVEMILNCGATTPKGFYGLRGMSERYLDLTIDKEVRSEFRDWGYKPFTKEQIEYGAKDTVLPMYIADHQLKRVQLTNLGNCVQLEANFLPALAEIELKGFYLDIDLWLENEQKYHKVLNEHEVVLQKRLIELQLPEIEDFNWNSPKQVSELFESLGIPVTILDAKKSTEGHPVYKKTVGKSHLEKYTSKYPIVKEYLEYKELKKLISSYGEKFLRHINPVTGRVHTSFYQVLDTGRISSSGPNLQNIPNEEKRPGFRNCFIGDLVVCDYSSQEGRILADRANETAMIDFFLTGDGDIHSFIARNMFKCEVSKAVKDEDGNILKEATNIHLRQQGKITNFTIA